MNKCKKNFCHQFGKSKWQQYHFPKQFAKDGNSGLESTNTTKNSKGKTQQCNHISVGVCLGFSTFVKKITHMLTSEHKSYYEQALLQ